MNFESIHKLLKSDNVDDCIIGYNILLNMEDEDVLSFFRNYAEDGFDDQMNTYGIEVSEVVHSQLLLRNRNEEYNVYVKKGDYYMAMTTRDYCLDTLETAKRCKYITPQIC